MNAGVMVLLAMALAFPAAPPPVSQADRVKPFAHLQKNEEGVRAGNYRADCRAVELRTRAELLVGGRGGRAPRCIKGFLLQFVRQIVGMAPADSDRKAQLAATRLYPDHRSFREGAGAGDPAAEQPLRLS